MSLKPACSKAVPRPVVTATPVAGVISGNVSCQLTENLVWHKNGTPSPSPPIISVSGQYHCGSRRKIQDWSPKGYCIRSIRSCFTVHQGPRA
ncbi:hypothetical protein OE88DRAFT_1660654, partial [Heliocybe sulcata]